MPSKRSKVHPKYKRKYRVRNWPEYEKSLVQRGSLTIWFSKEALEAWAPPKSGKPGGQQRYSDLAIETTLTLGIVFHLTLREAEGFVGSLLNALDMELTSPDHTTLSRRAKALNPLPFPPIRKGPVQLIVDSTGLQLFGQGQWAAAKYGERGKRGWKKLHIAVDESGFIMSDKLTDKEVDDASVVPGLVEQMGKVEINSFTADGAYDDEGIYGLFAGRGAETIVPPRKDAVISRGSGAGIAARNRTVKRVQEIGRREWRKESGWHNQTRAENTFFRYKRLLGSRLRFRNPDGQLAEVRLSCNILNRMAELGMSDSYPIGV